MPYKDPEKRKEAAREAHKRYVAKNRARVKLMRAEYHQKNLQKRRADIRANNERLGLSNSPRPKGPRSREELVVPLSRKWFLFTDQDGQTRVYFTFKKGFTAEELLDILKHLTTAQVKARTTLTKDIQIIPAPHEDPAPAQPAGARPARQRSNKPAKPAKAHAGKPRAGRSPKP